MDDLLAKLLFGVGVTILPFGFLYAFIRLQIHVYAVKVNAAANNKGLKSGLDLLFFRPRKFWLICKAAFSADIKLRQAAVELLYPQYVERLQQAKAEYRAKRQQIIDTVNTSTGGDKFQVELLNRRFQPADLHPDMVRVSFLDDAVPAETVAAIATVIRATFDGFDRTQFDRVAVALPDGRSGMGSQLTVIGPRLP